MVNSNELNNTPVKGKKGLRRIINAFGYSLKGFKAAWAHEAAFRQELTACVILLPLALWLEVSSLTKIMLVAVMAIVIIVELLNSAIEAAIDRIGPEAHHLSGAAKDLGSAAVLVALSLMVFVWGVVLWDVFQQHRA